MLLYSLTESSDNYLKTSGILWQYYRDELDLNNDRNVANFPSNSFLFQFKQKEQDKSLMMVIQKMLTKQYHHNTLVIFRKLLKCL